MGMFLNRGIEEFKNVLDSEIYVDKTDIIVELNKFINTEQRYICISRPRRFGKSITANMIAAYYEKGSDSTLLFVNRKLAQKDPDDWKRQMNQYDVIRVDFAELTAQEGNPEAALDFFESGLLKDLQEKYGDQVEIDVQDGKLADVLDRINTLTQERFVIIIDEWDCFFRDQKSNQQIQQRYINLLRSLFKGNRSKKFLALAYITGILPIKRYNSESALNNFYEYTMIEPANFGSYVGFIPAEVQALCKEYNMDVKEVEEWYDGYELAVWKKCKNGRREKYIEHIYSPNSVVRAMLSGRCSNYWSQTVVYNSLLTYMAMNFDGLKDDMIAMISGERVPVKVRTFQNDMVNFRNKHDVLTVLIHLGYLAYDEENEEAWIPNKEVRMCFEDNLEETGWTEVIEAIEASEDLFRATLEKEEEEVAAQIDFCHSKNTSIIKYNNENALACVLTLAYYSAKKDYSIIRELPGGYGFADLVFLPKKNRNVPAMIIELKWKQDAETALNQIKTNKYLESLDGYHGKVLLVGINYEKAKRGETAKKKHSCLIEELTI